MGSLAPTQQDAARTAPFKPGDPHIESRRVGAQRAAADQNRIMPRAFHMRVGAGLRSRDPAAGAIGERDLPVEREAELERHMRPPQRLAQHEPRHGARGFVCHQAHLDRDAPFAQPGRPLPVGARIGIAQRDHHARHASARQKVSAARPARGQMKTGFQRHITASAMRPVERLFQRLRLGMGSAALLRPATPHDPAVPHDDAADIGIGGGKPASAPRQRDGGGHEAPVGGRVGYRHRSAQGCCAPSACLALASRSSSIALIRVSASLRLALLRSASSRHSIPTMSATFCMSFWLRESATS